MNKTGPSRWLYLLAAILFIGGWVAAGTTVIKAVSGDLGKGLIQVVVPGEEKLEFDQAGTYTIFHEYESVYKNQVFSISNSSNISGLELTVKSEATGEQLSLRPSTSSSYSLGSRLGRSLYKFDVDTPGTYVLSGKYPDGDGPKVVLAVSHGFLRKMFGTVFGAIAYVLAGTLLGVGLAIYTFLKRR